MPMVNAQRRPQSEPRCGVDCLPADLSAGMPHGTSHKPHSQRFLGLSNSYTNLPTAFTSSQGTSHGCWVTFRRILEVNTNCFQHTHHFTHQCIQTTSNFVFCRITCGCSHLGNCPRIVNTSSECFYSLCDIKLTIYCIYK